MTIITYICGNEKSGFLLSRRELYYMVLSVRQIKRITRGSLSLPLEEEKENCSYFSFTRSNYAERENICTVIFKNYK